MSTTTTTFTLRVGQHLTDYANCEMTIERLASGGFGLVAFGPDRLHDSRTRALKTVRPELLQAAPRLRDLFIREALTWVGLWPHANLLTAHSVTEINGQPFLVLDYAEHGSLRDLLAYQQPFATRLAWAQHIAAGLVALHSPDPAFLRDRPLVHRDLKPENVLVDGAEFALITDFGLAKAVADALGDDPDAADKHMPVGATTTTGRYQTRRGVAMGTLAYMAPEQWEDAASAGPPADCYAFGLILAELLTSEHPLLPLDVSYSEGVWRAAHFGSMPRSLRAAFPALPAAVENLYQALLAKRPDDRPTAAMALATLQAAASTLGEEPYTPPEVYPRTLEHQRIMWHDCAVAYLRFGFYNEALARNERAIALDAHNFNLLLVRGNILGQMGHIEEALAAYTSAEATLAAEDTWHRGMLWNQRGTRFNEMGRYAEAEGSYAQALVLRPNQTDSWFNRARNMGTWGLAEARASHGAEARALWTAGLAYIAHATSLNPNDPDNYQLQATLQQLLAELSE